MISSLCDDLDSHGLGTSDDSGADSLERQVSHAIVRLLDLCNLIDLLQVNLADKGVVLANVGSSLLNSGSALEKERGRGRFGDKGKSTVALDGDNDGKRSSGVDVLGPVVELFAEIHRLDSTLTESGSDGGRGGGLSGGDDQTEERSSSGGGLLRHG